MNKNRITCLIEVPHLISVNGAYSNKSKTQRYMTPDAAMEKQKIRTSLRDTGLVSGSWGNDESWYKIELTYFLATNFSKRDVDNLNKLVLDAVTEFLGFDDSRFMTVIANKCKLEHSKSKDSEFIKFTISKVTQNIIERKSITDLFINHNNNNNNKGGSNK